MSLNESEVLAVIRRLVKAGPIDALPRKHSDLLILLALASAQFVGGRVYREDEINAKLEAWLARFASETATDYVTFRRLLVDQHFLLRDAAGTAYRTGRVGTRLSASARRTDPGAVVEEMRSARLARKHAHARTADDQAAPPQP